MGLLKEPVIKDIILREWKIMRNFPADERIIFIYLLAIFLFAQLILKVPVENRA